MIDRIRQAVEQASKVVEAPRRRAEDLARDLVRDLGKALPGSGASKVAEKVLEQAREHTRTARSLMTGEVRRQMRRMGVATSEEVDRLSRRITELEVKAGAPAPEIRPVRRRRPSGTIPSPEELAEKKVRRPSRAAAPPGEAKPPRESEETPRPPANRRSASRTKPVV
ncbi:MAG: hypothetical protein ACRDJF_03705 [Actinomycetota bacterium]